MPSFASRFVDKDRSCNVSPLMGLAGLDVMFYVPGLRAKQFHFEIVAINDIADVHTLVHLFKYDSTHGRFNGKVDITIENEKIYLNIQSNQRLLKVEVLQQNSRNFYRGQV